MLRSWIRPLALLLLAVSALSNGVLPAELPRDRSEAIESLLRRKMEEAGIPGLSVAIALDGAIAWEHGYGLADLENSVPATPRTAYRTASIGKPMTATAVMQLAESGALDLDAPVQRYCPAFPKKRWKLTTRQLLTHTGGIRHYGGPQEEEELYNTRHYDDVVQPLDIFKDDRLRFEPGTRFEYSTFGYNLLGCVIEGASGERYLEYMRRHVFEPAGMESTRDDDPAAIVPWRADGYVVADDGTLRNARRVDMSSKMPAGGFITTAGDLARFAAAVMSHRLIREETLAAMRTPTRLADGDPTTYGIGWAVSPPDDLWYGYREMLHGGGTPQVSGILYLLPERAFAVAILTNLEDVPERVPVAAEIARIVLDLKPGS